MLLRWAVYSCLLIILKCQIGPIEVVMCHYWLARSCLIRALKIPLFINHFHKCKQQHLTIALLTNKAELSLTLADHKWKLTDPF